MIQRKCRECGSAMTSSGKCSACANRGTDKKWIDRKSQGGAAQAAMAPALAAQVHEVVGASGAPLDSSLQTELSTRLGHDFSRVRVHSDPAASETARSLEAMAYTHGQHVVFGRGFYEPHSRSGLKLLVHELAHVVQQSGDSASPGDLSVSSSDDAAEREADAVASGFMAESNERSPSIAATNSAVLQRACLPAADCSAPIPGSSAEFGAQEENIEQSARERRARQSPQRQRASGHTGPARQLEIFLEAQAPGLLANIHGIFVDQDLSPGTGALTMDCASMVPPILGAVKPCVFIHGALNQEALRFNKTAEPSIGGLSREDWRISTLQILTHEVQHVIFDSSGRPAPAAAVGCARASVAFELSELNAIMSEFPAVFRAIPAGAAASDPARTRLDNWFSHVITNPGESIQGILKKLRCTCDCPQVDAWVIDTFNFASSSWSVAERDAFNIELRRAVWGLTWPL